jgi:glycosyltransferase involved in cell wall biosynthesis
MTHGGTPERDVRPDVSLSIPCYNEQDVLRNTVTRLVRAFDSNEVRVEFVLVDNGSTDRTGAIIDALIAEGVPAIKIAIPQNRGYGYGIVAGLEACRGRFIGFLHADGQVEAHDVVKVYDVVSKAAQPVLGKVRRRFRMDGLTRKLVSIAYNGLANVMFPGLGSIDINGSPKIWPREYLARMNLQSADWFLDPELIIKARRLGLQIVEFNVLAQMRVGGKSHVNWHTCWEFLVNLTRYRVGRIPGRERAHQVMQKGDTVRNAS